jgi:hypothetical protein
MLHPFNTHKNPKTCITWIQNMIKYHKVKINRVKGKFGGKPTIIFMD